MKQRLLVWIGNTLITLGVLVVFLPVGPALFSELKYYWKHFLFFQTDNSPDVVAHGGFHLSIPKIDANSEVLIDIDPFNKNEYLDALKLGIAHARNTALPGEDGNIYLFAHSTDAPWNISRYNAEFYLLHKLESGDKVYITYNTKQYIYQVKEKMVVSESDVAVLNQTSGRHLLTMQTCWPPGTTWKRLLIVAEEI